jgi:hypothetical protein
MIKFEHNMLVLNSSFSNDDVQEINDFADYVRLQERERIIKLIDSISRYEKSDETSIVVDVEYFNSLVNLDNK